MAPTIRSEYLVKGRGFRVKVRQGSWVETFDSDPESGCFKVTRSSSHGFEIRVYGFATDSAGNHVRIHDAQTDTSEYYPGNTYSECLDGSDAVGQRTNDYVLDGRASDRWTTIAAAAYALYRYHDGNAGKTISSVSPKVTAVVQGRSTATLRTTSRATRPI